MPITVAYVLALMSALSPLAPRSGNAMEFASAIAEIASVDPVPDGVSREMSSALLVVYAWHEGRYRRDVAASDHGWSHCSLSVHAAPGSDYARRLEASALACVRGGLASMRASYATCGGMDGYCGACARVFGARYSRAAIAIATERDREARLVLDRAASRP